MGPINSGPKGPGPCPPGPYGAVGAPGIPQYTAFNNGYYMTGPALCSCFNESAKSPNLVDLMVDFIHHKWDIAGLLMKGMRVADDASVEIYAKFNGNIKILQIDTSKNTVSIYKLFNGPDYTGGIWQALDVTNQENWKIIEHHIDQEMIRQGIGHGGHAYG